MPGTTRYSATFDRPYEEEDREDSAPPANARRSRSQSLQAYSGHNGRAYTPLLGRIPSQRSSSTDNGPAKGVEHIPTRTAKTTVKAHNNPFQFVKVGTCPLYKKAEEQLQKAKEVKKPEVLKEEEEEWQVNLDSWKSRRRKMSEDVFRRQEEIKQLELEEQIAQVSQKKTKTFSEMVESRATRGRALSLCLLTSPLEFQNWEFENKSHKNGSCSYTDESGDNSTVNSEDEGVSVRGRLGESSQVASENNHRTNGDAHIEQNGQKLNGTQNGDYKKLTDNVQMKPKESSYIDSGLESISSSHRAGDTPDSGSDFSQDSNSSIDCDSPRTGVNVLEDFSSKPAQMSEGQEITIKLNLKEKGQDFGFTFLGGKDEGQVLIASVLEGSMAESLGIHLGDRIITIDGTDVSSKKHIEIAAMLQKGRERGQIKLLLWRHTKTSKSTNGVSVSKKHINSNTQESLNAKLYEKSIESENEMFVDDFEELQKQSELLALKKEPETSCTNSQAQTNGNKSPTFNKDAIPLKTSLENSTASNLKETISNGAVEEPHKIELKTYSDINNENPKKNIVKVKRVRRKGVHALNVDSNHIPQEGISANSLFPLSPVTELPSPSDETKTMSSTLSSDNIAVCNSQNEICNKEKPREGNLKPSTSVVQENNKTAFTTTKSASPEVVSPSESKTSEKMENKNEAKAQNKNESAAVPLSPTASKNEESNSLCEGSQNEKSKPPSAPKKIKVKVKKGTTSANNSATSPSIKEPSPSFVLSTDPVESFPKEKDSKSTSIVPDKLANKVSSSAVTDVKQTSDENEKQCKSVSSVKNLSLETNAKTKSSKSSLSPPVASAGQPKSPVIEKSKPVISQKKKIIKTKETTEGIAQDCPQKVVEFSNISDSNSSDPFAKNKPKEFQSKKIEKLSLTAQEKQEKFVSKRETAVDSIAVEKDLSLPTITTTVQEVKEDLAKEVIHDKCVSLDKNHSLGTDTKMESSNSSLASPVASTELLKSPVVEKTKPVATQKKKIIKIKEKTAEQTPPDSLQKMAENSNIVASNSSDLSAKDKSREFQMKQNEKSSPIAQGKQEKVVIEKETAVLSVAVEKDLSSATVIATLPDLKQIPAKEEIQNKPISVDKKLSLKTDAKMELCNPSLLSPVTSAQPPKSPATEKSKPLISQKKKHLKAKENVSEKTSSDISQKLEENSELIASYSSDLSVKNKAKLFQKKDEKASPIAQGKVIINNRTTAPPFTAEKTLASATVPATALEVKQSPAKEAICSRSSSSDKNPSLKTDAKIESSDSSLPSTVANGKLSKSPVTEKSKPVFSQKKENIKTKVVEKSVSSVSNTSDVSTENTAKKSQQDKEQIAIPNEDKQVKMASKSEKIIPSVKKGITEKQALSNPMQVDKQPCNSSISSSSESISKNKIKETQFKKEEKAAPVNQDIQAKTVSKNKTAVPTSTRENSSISSGITTITVLSSAIDTIADSSASVDKTEIQSLKTVTKNESTSASPVTNAKPPKTPQDEKSNPVSFQKKENTKLKERDNVIPSAIAVCAYLDKNESLKSPSATDPSCNVINNVSSVTSDNKTDSVSVTSEVSSSKNDVTDSSSNPQEEKSKLSGPKRSRNRSKKKVI